MNKKTLILSVDSVRAWDFHSPNLAPENDEGIRLYQPVTSFVIEAKSFGTAVSFYHSILDGPVPQVGDTLEVTVKHLNGKQATEIVD